MRALPTAAIISWGTRKIPEPMMMPTTIAVALVAVRQRGNSCAAADFCGSSAIAGRLPEAQRVPASNKNELEVKTFVSPVEGRAGLAAAQQVDGAMALEG